MMNNPSTMTKATSDPNRYPENCFNPHEAPCWLVGNSEGKGLRTRRRNPKERR